MRRRDLIKGITGSVITWPLRAGAQQPPVPVIGFLSTNTSDLVVPSYVPAFVHGLSEGDFIDGQNVTIQYRWANNQYDRLPALAGELVRHPVDVIVAVGGTASALAAQVATTTIPVIFNIGSDPVKLGLVASLNRPGGNITGISYLSASLVPKLLETLHLLRCRMSAFGTKRTSTLWPRIRPRTAQPMSAGSQGCDRRAAMFDHQSLASPRACLLGDWPNSDERGDVNEGSVTNARFV